MNWILDWLDDRFVSWGMHEKAADVVSYFVFETAKILVLLFVAIFIFSLLRTFLISDKFIEKLKGRSRIILYIGMAALGAISPFCSCSAIPAFITFLAAGIPIGPAFAYLITAPLIQEASFILLLEGFGVPITAIYVVLGMSVGILSGFLIEKFDEKKIIVSDILIKRNRKMNGEEIETGCGCKSEPKKETGCGCKSEPKQETSCGCNTEPKVETGCGCKPEPKQETSCGCKPEPKTENGCGCDKESKNITDPKSNPVKYAFNEAKGIIKSTYLYVLIGIGIGAFIHGLVPADFIEKYLGRDNLFSPILATIVGIPIYADEVSLIPVAKTLVQEKGAGLGTAISFLMAAAVVSIPSFALLSRVLKKKAIVYLVMFLTVCIILIGYFFNAISPYVT